TRWDVARSRVAGSRPRASSSGVVRPPAPNRYCASWASIELSGVSSLRAHTDPGDALRGISLRTLGGSPDSAHPAEAQKYSGNIPEVMMRRFPDRAFGRSPERMFEKVGISGTTATSFAPGHA